MQCPNCRFQNMPGLESCGRCGTSLALATAVLDVNPPRATSWQKHVRRWLPWRSVNNLRYAARDHRISVGKALDEAAIALPESRLLARLIIPGWAHFFQGQ